MATSAVRAEGFPWHVSKLRMSEWRAHRGMTQRDLAQRSGLAVTTINEIETGKRTPRGSTLHRLAAALGTEEWNLFNHPAETWSSVPEAAQALERLGKVAAVFSQSAGGLGLAAEVARSADDMGVDVDDMVAAAEEAIVLLIPFWIRAGAWLTGQMSPEEAQQDARVTEAAVPWRVREWTDQDIPPAVAEVLLRAQAQALTRMATMLASDANGSHDDLT